MPKFQVLPTESIAPEEQPYLQRGYPLYAIVKYTDGNIYPICGCFTKEEGNQLIKGWKKGAKKSIFAKTLLRD